MIERTAEPPGRFATGAAAGWVLLIVFVLGAALLGDIYAGTIRVGGWELPRIGAWQFLYGLGFAGYVLLLVSFRRRAPAIQTVVVAAILLRVLLLLCPPNSDCNRYAWEGMIQRQGFNPYAAAPDDPALEHLRDDVWEGINKKHYPTIYPPLSELEFRLIATIHYGVKGPQVAHALWDAAVVLVLAVWIARAGLPAWHLAIYALCPLVLAAFAHAGHNDALMILGVLGFVAAGEKKRWPLAGFALGLAVLAKTTPAILLVLLVRRSKVALGVALLTVVLGYLLYADAGSKLFFALTDFPTQSSFNNLFDEIRIHLKERAGWIVRAHERNCVALVLLAAAAAYRVRRQRDLLSDARWLLAAVVLLLPIIHFWYLSWVIALVALGPKNRWPWLLLCGTMVFYWQADFAWQTGGRWKLPLWAACAIWVPFFAAWIGAWARTRRGGPLRPGRPSRSGR